MSLHLKTRGTFLVIFVLGLEPTMLCRSVRILSTLTTYKSTIKPSKLKTNTPFLTALGPRRLALVKMSSL